jgi:hypothetical protein
MAPWRTGILTAIVAMSSMPQMDCDMFSEPATRLENCLEKGVEGLTKLGAVRRVTCNLRMEGRYTVVFHPPGEVGNEALRSAGLPEALIPEFRSMRLRGSPAIYVIASDRAVKGLGSKRTIASSRTTRQSTFVQIDQLMVITRTTPSITIEVGRPYGANVIQRVR